MGSQTAVRLLLDAGDPRAVDAQEAVDAGHQHDLRPLQTFATRAHRPQRREAHVSAYALYKADFGFSYHCFCRLSKSKFGCATQSKFPKNNRELN